MVNLQYQCQNRSAKCQLAVNTFYLSFQVGSKMMITLLVVHNINTKNVLK